MGRFLKASLQIVAVAWQVIAVLAVLFVLALFLIAFGAEPTMTRDDLIEQRGANKIMLEIITNEAKTSAKSYLAKMKVYEDHIRELSEKIKDLGEKRKVGD